MRAWHRTTVAAAEDLRSEMTRGNGYRNYVLALLTAACMFNYIDRNLVVMLLEPIKLDLGLTDTQLGLLTGILFGLFYATVGVPVARWSDRGDRVTIASIALGLWALTFMASVFITSYLQLVIARILAATGESGCKPPTYSLVGDYFPGAAERARAMAVYMAGSPISALVSFAIGGVLNELFGWRLTFLIMGVPGLILAVMMKLSVREPRLLKPSGAGRRGAPSFNEVLTTLWRCAALRHLCIGLTLLYTMGLGLGPWYAAFMVRSHGMNTAELGVFMGLIFSLGGIVGVLVGGAVSSRWLAGRERTQLVLSAAALTALVPFFFCFLTLSNRYAALASLFPLMVVFYFYLGPTYAVMQRLVPSNMRATMMAVMMLIANLVGMGIGPLAVGMISDSLAPSLGAESLRYAMMSMALVSAGAGFHFWRASRTVEGDLAAAMEPDAVAAAHWPAPIGGAPGPRPS